MHFASLIAVAGFLAVVPSALATITITSPSSSIYWVQNTSNTIAWEFNPGDPTPVSITITNPNTTDLNGNFAIAENVVLSNKTFTVTNVTLKVASGYIVNFVNGSNIENILAQSSPFDVKAPGTPATSQPTPSATSPSATGTGTSSSGSTNSSATTASGASGSASSKSNASLRSFDGSLMTLAPLLGMSALMSVLGALATL